ncbi:outer membrane protein [Lonepinella sp. MS14435]|uniref:outer membrane protein n=1 Tax=Lonepinella sp. MS14435 TaxID=3003618 RepID=UPI0036DA32EA
MKKTAILTALLAISATSTANADNFKGWAVGAEINSVKHEATMPVQVYNNYYSGHVDLNTTSSRKVSVGGFGQFAFTFAQKFTGIAEIKFRSGGSKSTHSAVADYYVKEKANFSATYAQGYQITDKILPYVKIGYAVSSLDIQDSYKSDTIGAHGVIYGLGVKYSITPNVIAGLEYTKARLEDSSASTSDYKVKLDNIGLNVSYRF